MSQSLEDVDPFRKRNNEYTFGEKLCTNYEFLAKSILLSKNGMKVYFLKRDYNQKSDIIMSVELLPTRPDSDGTAIEVQITKVFKFQQKKGKMICLTMYGGITTFSWN